jgi:hypothetical protein
MLEHIHGATCEGNTYTIRKIWVSTRLQQLTNDVEVAPTRSQHERRLATLLTTASMTGAALTA